MIVLHPEVETSAGSFNISAQRNSASINAEAELNYPTVTLLLSSSHCVHSITDSAIQSSLCASEAAQIKTFEDSKKDGKLIVKCSFACFGGGTLACLFLLSCLNNYHRHAYFLPSNLRSPHISSGCGEARRRNAAAQHFSSQLVCLDRKPECSTQASCMHKHRLTYTIGVSKHQSRERDVFSQRITYRAHPHLCFHQPRQEPDNNRPPGLCLCGAI